MLKSVYFFGEHTYPSGWPTLSHEIICLAEGFLELGVAVYGNMNIWPLSTNGCDWLIKYDPNIAYFDCDVVIFSHFWVVCDRLRHNNQFKVFPDFIFTKSRKYKTVFVDHCDGSYTMSHEKKFRQFDLVLKAHYSSKLAFPTNTRPWPFAFSNRIINSITPQPFEKRKNNILVNFRVEHKLRSHIKLHFIPLLDDILPPDYIIDERETVKGDLDRLWYKVSHRRHHPGYFERLASASAVACFGGMVLPDIYNYNILRRPITKYILNRKHINGNKIVQWDNWRLWETLAAGAVAFHLDFIKYGMEMPIMRENYKHYIGIDLDNFDIAIEKIKSDKNLLSTIGENGRKWALEHYNPKACVKRLIEMPELK